MLVSEQGSLVASWAAGVAPNRIRFDARSQMTTDIRNLSETKQYIWSVREALATGGKMRATGGYNAGIPGPFNTHLWRDGATAMFWPFASNENRTLLALGTHDIEATAVTMQGTNSAVVTFMASNSITLGSLVRGIGTTDFWNGLPGSTGMFSQVDQEFVRREIITW